MTIVYASLDSVTAGVGASQVQPYVTGLADEGVPIRLHSFEPTGGHGTLTSANGIEVPWVRHPFGELGARGGAGRLVRLARALPRGQPVHARSDLAAAAAVIGGAEPLIWDIRSLWRDQRIALGVLRRGSPPERVIRGIEHLAASRAAAIVVLAAAALPVLYERHPRLQTLPVAVVPTAADLDRFPFEEPRDAGRIELLLSGTVNTYYDVPTMIGIVDALRRRRPVRFSVLAPPGSPYDALLDATADERTSCRSHEVPEHVRRASAGLSVCHVDAGPSLKAAMPTKIAEFLASGRPVVVNPGLGDMDSIIRDFRCGVVVDRRRSDGVERAAEELLELLDDSNLGRRCRNAAEQHFSLDVAVGRLLGLYRELGIGRRLPSR